MSKGERLVLDGLLLTDRGRLILHMKDGGEWRLETTRGYAKLIGKRVSVTGTRDGFDLLAVSRIDPA
jgi:hypothetical protein